MVLKKKQEMEHIDRDLTEEERYNIWFANNYETGMEKFFDPNNLPNYDDPYYEPTPKRTRELFPLPKHKIMDSQSGLTETLEFESNLFIDEQEEIEIWDVTLLDGLEEE